MKYLTSLFLLLFLNTSMIAAKFTPSDNKNLAVIYTFDKDIRDRYDAFLEKDLKEIGYFLNDPHKNVNKVYEQAYGSTALDNLAFGSIVDESVVRPMFNIDPRLAGFSPFNLLIYKKKSEKETYIAHLTPEAILDILEIDNSDIRERFIKSFEPLDKMISERLGGKKSILLLHGYAKDTMMNFEIPFEEPEDIDDFLEEFQEKFETAFISRGYIIAGFYNFKESFNSDTDDLEQFESFWSYALCHLTFSYNVFDHKNGLPIAGIFAPCSMYVYVKKGENKLVIGMPTLNAWGAALGVKDPEKLKLMNQLDTEIPDIIHSLGGKDIPNGNPLVANQEDTTPLPNPTVQSGDLSKILALLQRLNQKVDKLEKLLATKPSASQVITTSSATKQTTSQKKPRKVTSPSHAGTINHRELPTFLRAPYASAEQIAADLQAAGFEVLAITPIDKKGKLTTVTFTSEALKEMADQSNRGFIGVMSALVNKKDKKVSITNPLYFAKAYLQDDFDETTAKALLDKLNHTFENLKSSEDGVEADKLAHYQYMMRMPTYDDMVVIAQGKDLLQKLKNSKKIAFQLKLNDETTLVGVSLSNNTGRFIKKIGLNNAALLPYLMLIENNQAKILAPKYQIALYYPKLSMGEFGAVATTPGALIKEFEKLFK